jgi:hypothetical protein
MIPSLNHNRDQPPRTSLHSIETVSIRGLFTCDPSQPRIVYSCSFTEEREPSTFFKAVTQAESDFRNDVGHPRYDESPSSAKASMRNSVKGTLFSPEEDELIVSLKTEGLSWSDIAKHFPGRTEGSLRVRYCTRLKHRVLGSRKKQPGRARSILSSARSALNSDPVPCFTEGVAPSQR